MLASCQQSWHAVVRWRRLRGGAASFSSSPFGGLGSSAVKEPTPPNGRTIMTTHGETLSTITTPTKAVTAAPRLRELTYRYQPKRAPDGEPIRLGAVIRDPKTSAAALTTLLHDEAVEVFGI